MDENLHITILFIQDGMLIFIYYLLVFFKFLLCN